MDLAWATCPIVQLMADVFWSSSVFIAGWSWLLYAAFFCCASFSSKQTILLRNPRVSLKSSQYQVRLLLCLFHTADTDKTRQNCLVLSCPRLRCELGIRVTHDCYNRHLIMRVGITHLYSPKIGSTWNNKITTEMRKKKNLTTNNTYLASTQWPSESDWRCFRGCAISSSYGRPQNFFQRANSGMQKVFSL